MGFTSSSRKLATGLFFYNLCMGRRLRSSHRPRSGASGRYGSVYAERLPVRGGVQQESPGGYANVDAESV